MFVGFSKEEAEGVVLQNILLAAQVSIVVTDSAQRIETLDWIKKHSTLFLNEIKG